MNRTVLIFCVVWFFLITAALRFLGPRFGLLPIVIAVAILLGITFWLFIGRKPN
jgi:hypothetical protein